MSGNAGTRILTMARSDDDRPPLLSALSGKHYEPLYQMPYERLLCR